MPIVKRKIAKVDPREFWGNWPKFLTPLSHVHIRRIKKIAVYMSRIRNRWLFDDVLIGKENRPCFLLAEANYYHVYVRIVS